MKQQHCSLNPTDGTLSHISGTTCDRTSGTGSPIWGVNGGVLPYSSADANQRFCLGLKSGETYRPFALDKGRDEDGSGARTINPGNNYGSEDIITPIPNQSGFNPPAVYDPNISIAFGLTVCSGTCP